MPPLAKRLSFTPRIANRATTSMSITANNRRRRTRQGILAGIVLVLGGIAVLFVYNNTTDLAFQLSVESASIGANNTVEIEGLVYTGTTNDGQEFTLSAKKVYETANIPNRIIMEVPEGRITSANHGIITMKAERGAFFRKANIARLMGGIVLEQSASGYVMHGEELSADLDGGIIESQKPIYGFSVNANIHADGIIISQADNDVTFLGKARLVINSNGAGE